MRRSLALLALLVVGYGPAAAPSSARDAGPSLGFAASSAAADAVDAERWRATVADLAAFRTRYTGTPSANAARDYIADQFTALGLSVETPSFDAGSGTGYDVVGELRGTTRPDDIYIVCAHYDSISEQPTVLAPGAEDNASGTAGVVELARVLTPTAPAATIRFIAFSGEEEGLYGSKFYVDRLVAAGESPRVKAVVNMDMIGYSRDEDLDVLLETSDVGRSLQRELAESAAAFTSLRVVKSLHPFGSDHVPFLRADIPCVLTIQNDWNEYPDYHSSRDTIENVRLDMGGQILRMNAATIARLAGETGPPDEPSATLTLAFPSDDRTIYGGFVQSAAWSVSGGEPTDFALELSLDGGTTFAPFGDFPAAARGADFVLSDDLRSASVVFRLRASFDDGSIVEATADPVRVHPGHGPKLRSVRFGDATFELRGRFDAELDRVEVDGVALDTVATLASSRIRGNTCDRIGVRGVDLERLFPVGVDVGIRVVDMRTGLATAELRVRR